MPVFMMESYPPVSQFDPDVGAAELIESIRASNDEPIPRPLALVLPLPSTMQPEFAHDIDRLRREIDLVARLCDRDRDVVELHVTACEADAPWRHECFSELLDALAHQFHFLSAAAGEMTIHADPRVLRPSEIATLAAAHFNRMAFTAACVDPRMVEACRNAGFRSLEVAIVDGAAAAASPALEAALDIVLASGPERVRIARCDGHARDRVTERIRGQLELAGYVSIGPELCALATDELAVALRAGGLRYGPFGYTPHADCDWLGFGPGAISHVGDCRVRNAEDPSRWRRDIDGGRLPARSGRLLSPDDRIRADVIQQLLCRGMIAIRELEQRHGIQFRRWFAANLANLAPCFSDGLAHDLGDQIVVGSRGWSWLSRMAACFASGDIAVISRESAQAH